MIIVINCSFFNEDHPLLVNYYLASILARKYIWLWQDNRDQGLMSQRKFWWTQVWIHWRYTGRVFGNILSRPLYSFTRKRPFWRIIMKNFSIQLSGGMYCFCPFFTSFCSVSNLLSHFLDFYIIYCVRDIILIL